MSKTVDSRVVEMRFDNKQFEKNVQTSMNTLDKLNSKLNLTGAAKGLESVSKAAQKVDVSNLSNSLESVRVKFSALQVMGATALSNLTNSAMNFGKRIGTALTSPIIDGGKKRAFNIEQAKFQFKGLGMDVEKAMASASEAVDGTAYGLDAAAKVAGQFGASGMQAGDEMTSALRAISGVAAMTGGEYEDIGCIFTTVAGQGRLMGDQLLQLSSRGINAASILSKEMGKSEAEVRDMVSKGKISFEQFYKAMDNAFGEHAKAANDTFTGAMANVRSALGRIGADFIQPLIATDNKTQNLIAVFNALRNAINYVHKAMRPLVGEINAAMLKLTEFTANKIVNFDLAWIEPVFEGVINVFSELQKAVKPIMEAFNEVFPPKTAEDALKLAEQFRNLTQKFKIGEKELETIKSVFKGLFSVISVGIHIVSGLLSGLKSLFVFFSPVFNGVISLSAAFGNLFTKFDEMIKKSEIVESVTGSIDSALNKIGNTIKDVTSKISAMLSKFASIDFSMFDVISVITEKVKAAFKTITNVISNAMQNFGFDSLLDVFNGGLLTGILLGINKFANSLGKTSSNLNKMVKNASGFLDKLGKSLSGSLEKITGLLDGVRGCLEAWQSNIKAGTLLKIASAVGILAVSLAVLSTIDPVRMTSALSGITVLFAELIGAMKLFTKIADKGDLKNLNKIAVSMIGLSSALLILSFAVKNLAGLNWNQLAVGLTGITVLLGELVGVSAIMSKNKIGMVEGSAGLTLLSTALVILSSAVKNLAGLDWNQLAVGLTGITVLLGELVGASAIISKCKVGLVEGSVGLILLSSALSILCLSVKSLAVLNWNQLAIGLTGITVLLGELVVVSEIMSGQSASMIASAIGILEIAAALSVLAKIVTAFSALEPEKLEQGLIGTGALLAGIMIAFETMDGVKDPKKIIVAATGIAILSAALTTLSGAVKKLGSMSWQELSVGLTALGGSLLFMVMAITAMEALKGALAGAAALLVVAGALAVLTPVLSALGAMSLEQLGMSLLALAGTFTVLGLAALVLSPLTPVLVALGIAVAAVGVGMLSAGAGVLAFATGLTMLGAAFAVNGAVIIAALESIINLLPLLATKIGESIVASAVAIGQGAGAISEAVTNIIIAILQSMIDTTPKMVEAVTTMLKGVLETIRNVTPDIVDTVILVLGEILEGLVEFVPHMVDAGLRLMTGLLQGIAKNIGPIAQAGTDTIIAFLDAVGKQTPRIIDAGFKMMIDFINGLANSIRENTPVMMDAVNNLMDAVIESAVLVITNSNQRFTEAGKNVIAGLIIGIKSKISEVVGSASGVCKTILEKFLGFFNIQSPSRVMRDEVGRYIVQGIAEGITKDMSAEEAAEKKAQNIVNAFKAELDKLDLADTTSDLEYQLWSTQDGEKYGVSDKASKKQELLETQFQRQKERIALANGEFQQMVQMFGESSSEATESYNKLLQEEIKLEELRESISQVDYENRNGAYESSISLIEKELSLLEERNDLTEDEKTAKKMELLNRKFAAQNEITYNLGVDYKNICDMYGENSEKAQDALAAWIDAQSEWNKLKNDMKTASYQESMDWIAEQKDYDQLGKIDELAAYKRMVNDGNYDGLEGLKTLKKKIYDLEKDINSSFKDFCDERDSIIKESNQKRIELDKDYANKTKEINDKLEADIKKLDEEYANSVDSRAKSLYSAYNLFDEVKAKKDVSGATLMKNLQGQVDEFQDWRKTLDELSARGLNKALVEELQAMGPSSIAEIKALNSMSDSELAQYANLWSVKHAEAKERATEELEGLRLETQNQIATLRAQASSDLEDAKNEYLLKIDELVTSTDEKIKTLRQNFEEEVGLIKPYTEQEFTEMTENAKIILGAGGWDELGRNMVDGLILGIKDRTPEFKTTLEGMMTSGVDVSYNSVESHSPSKVFAKLGRFIVEGLIVGINTCKDKFSNSCSDMGEDAIGSMRSAISGITDIADGDMAYEPTIRPVIDLTNFHSGLNQMDYAMSADRSLMLGANAAYNNQNGKHSLMQDIASKIADSNAQTNNKLMGAIESLKSDFAGLVDKVGQLQVVMDTGTLVGAISPEMNRSLGTAAVMNGRGV